MTADSEKELLSVIESARELVRWEAEGLAGEGFPAALETSPEAAASTPARIASPADEAEATATVTLDTDTGPRLVQLAKEAAACTRCELHKSRTESVFARGTHDTDLVFVGEGPGYHEDQQGLPFVGRAGQLLDRMVAAIGYDRDGVYICNVVKCRPPDNRTPHPTEAAACAHYLVPQLQAVSPKVIVALGRCAAENLRCVPPTGKWRGTWGEWQGIPVMPTYHPAFLLRSPQFKKPVWEDLQAVLIKLGRPTPPRR